MSGAVDNDVELYEIRGTPVLYTQRLDTVDELNRAVNNSLSRQTALFLDPKSLPLCPAQSSQSCYNVKLSTNDSSPVQHSRSSLQAAKHWFSYSSPFSSQILTSSVLTVLFYDSDPIIHGLYLYFIGVLLFDD